MLTESIIASWEDIVISGGKNTAGGGHSSTGIRCGKVSGVDIDVTDSRVVKKIGLWLRKNWGNAPIRIGNAPKILMMYNQPNPCGKIRVVFVDQERGKQVLEILGQGQMFIADGVHPTTHKKYVWKNGNPIDCDCDFDLPEAGDFTDLIEYFSEVCKAEGWTLAGKGSSGGGSVEDMLMDYQPPVGVSTDELKRLLGELDPGVGYDDWIVIGMALHKETSGSDEGLVLYDEWSSRGHNYAGYDDVEKMWNGWKGRTVILNGRTLYKKAGKEMPKEPGEDEDEEITVEVKVSGLREELKICESVEDLAVIAQKIKPFPMLNREELVSDYQEAYKRLSKAKCPIKVARGKLAPTIEDVQELATNAVLERYGPRHILYSEKRFWAYKQGLWTQVSATSVNKIIYPILSRFGDRTKNLAESVLHQVSAAVNKDNFKFDLGENMDMHRQFDVYFKNCVVNVDREGILTTRKHRHEDYCTAQLPHRYVADAKCPRFQQCLEEIFVDDKDAVTKGQMLAEMFGYTFLRSNIFEKFIVLVGNGRNGKSLLLKLLERILGVDNTCAIGMAQMTRSFDRNNLRGKLANIVPELPEGAILPEAEIKSLTSGDQQTSDEKYGGHVNWHNFATLWFSSNYMPHTKDLSNGMLRRTILVEFNRQFTADDDDKFLIDTLTAEIPGIINYCLRQVAVALKQRDITDPSSCIELKRRWILEEDSAALFLSRCCIKTKYKEQRIEINDLYGRYVAWCDFEGLDYVYKKQVFGRKLTALGVKMYESNSKCYRIKLIYKNSSENDV